MLKDRGKATKRYSSLKTGINAKNMVGQKLKMKSEKRLIHVLKEKPPQEKGNKGNKGN